MSPPRFQLIAVGRGMPPPVRELVGEYLHRLERHGGCQLIEIAEEPRPPKSGPDPLSLMKKEADRILPHLAGGGLSIALALDGEALDSESLARRVGRWRDEGIRPLRFLIGGPDGLHPELRRATRHALSLGPMTYPHMLARVLILEQLYRAS
ncbi:MAG: 23S rRNA (pseudouridine(1915)-N(3))-methyltransferase RlmH, partial [Magnetococcales bacterium]|nr:23S rRNA (pseudouridine(1915)-N(3))-methyltransferase RlmH [Magnetococcales bacterium]